MSYQVVKHLFTVNDYERMTEAGILHEDDRESYSDPAGGAYRRFARVRQSEHFASAMFPDLTFDADALLA